MYKKYMQQLGQKICDSHMKVGDEDFFRLASMPDQ
jgi:hypothetical protein